MLWNTGDETMKTDGEKLLNINFCDLFGIMEQLVL